ncbi:GNAT family N-acetyltransferase [Tabrizicola aquatica]|uniref:GNAT family N-acetyltransferase n=1 Tax=Tabrizicola aquatica TaxID=909926 RepID=UPI000CCFECC8|nr:GNAT family N-acetyltransferase [Tabrizicola aquatica]
MTPEVLARVMEATWPPARVWRQGAFLCRDGAGGGKRVSAASCAGDWAEADLEALDHDLVVIRPGEAALDQALEARGWRLVDPVVAYAAPVAALTGDLPPLSAFAHWPPLEIARAIWAEGGIGPARVNVMARTAGPRAAILARHEDRPAGAAFVALDGDHAMVHAVEVRESVRRLGIGATLLRAAANWAASEGASHLSLVVTERNTAARALYSRLGMQVVGQYHYRMK